MAFVGGVSRDSSLTSDPRQRPITGSPSSRRTSSGRTQRGVHTNPRLQLEVSHFPFTCPHEYQIGGADGDRRESLGSWLNLALAVTAQFFGPITPSSTAFVDGVLASSHVTISLGKSRTDIAPRRCVLATPLGCLGEVTGSLGNYWGVLATIGEVLK